MKFLASILALTLTLGCARTWVNYPPGMVQGKDGTTRQVAARALELNGSDALGHTEFEVTSGGVRFVAAGGIDNSTSTKEGYRTVRHGVGTAGAVATAGLLAGAAQSAHQAQSASNVAQSKAQSATAIAAGKDATAIRLAQIAAREKAAGAALPLAGSTIPAQVPAEVIPVVAP